MPQIIPSVSEAAPQQLCPECQDSMTLVRTFEPAGALPQLAAFYCQPCQFAETVPLDLH